LEFKMKIGYSTINSPNFDFSASKEANRTALGRSAENFQAERFRNMQEGLQRIQSMPSVKELSKQDSMNKVGVLRQRLDALKAMLLHASPEQAESLTRQLKNIAGELASVAKSLGAGNGGQAAAPSGAEMVNAPPDEQASVESTVAGGRPAATEAGPTSTKTDETIGGRSDATLVSRGENKSDSFVATSGESGQKNSGGDSSSQETGGAVLRGLLLDAKKLFKEVVDMLKPKLAAAGKDAKEDMQAIEKSMSELDSALQQGSASSLYSEQGSVAFDVGSLAVSGLNIDLTA
jgi:hypothetical protein